MINNRLFIKGYIYSSHFSSFISLPFYSSFLFCSSSLSPVTLYLKPNLILPVPIQFTKKNGIMFWLKFAQILSCPTFSEMYTYGKLP